MFKARLKFEKMLAARYISHLDLMNLIQRSIARAGLPVWYTEGFNPHAYISILLPLPTGFSGNFMPGPARKERRWMPGRPCWTFSATTPPNWERCFWALRWLPRVR